MKTELNYWRTICFISVAIFSLSLLNVAVAQDLNPPSGMDKGVWVLKEKKPDFEPTKDEPLYFNNHVSVSGNTVKGGWSWRDDPVKPECSGDVWGTCNWEEIPSVIQPGVGQNTTLTADVGGSQSCAYRHVSARTELALNDQNLNEIYARTSYATSDPKPAPVSVKVPWEAPWGKIGDTFTVTVIAQVPGAVSNHFYYNYIYTYEAPGSQPKESAPTTQKEPVEQNPQQEYVPQLNKKPMAYIEQIEGEGDVRVDGLVVKSSGKRVPIFEGSTIRTGPNTQVDLLFKTGASARIQENAQFNLKREEFVKGDEAAIYGSLWNGMVNFFFPPGDEASKKFELETNLAFTSIEGTIFNVYASQDETVVEVAKGIVSVTSKATGDITLVNADKEITVTESGFEEPQDFDGSYERVFWENITSEVEDEREGIDGSSLITSVDNLQERDTWYAKGYGFFSQGKYDEALEAFDEAIELDSQYVDAWYMKGYTLNSQGKYDEAIKEYAVAIMLDPEYVSAWYAKGYALANMGRYDGAIEAYDEAIKVDSEYANAWYAKGYALYKLDRTTESDVAFAKAKELGYTP